MTDGSDLAWLGLERHDEGRWSFELTPPLSRMDGKLYGGTGIAVTVAAMEAETARDALWTTVQFAGSADIGERIDLHVEQLAIGRRTTQVRVTATVGDRVALAAVGATGAHRDGPVEAQIGTMPDVPGPEHAEPWGSRWRPAGIEMPKIGWLLVAEMKQVELGDERFAVWARMLDGRPQTRATMAFLADMVPSAVARAAGHMGGGTSLDNAMRFGRFADTEWILLDFDPWFATGGYLHGGARVWSEDGTLLGHASQTATAMVWTGERPPWIDEQPGGAQP
jgi:acyl-CoA thioesterase